MERDALAETAVGVGGVLLFVVATVAIGVQYTDEPDAGGQLLTETGAYGLVAAVAVFVALMSLLGIWLSRQ